MNIKHILEQMEELIQDTTGRTQDLYEFAINRKRVKDKIEDWSDVIVDHVCKIYYLRDRMPDTLHHWESEIKAQIDNIVQIQAKGGKLKESTLFEWMRNGLKHPKEMENRRFLVAMQEKIDVSICKELNPELDYSKVINTIKNLVNLVLTCREEHRLTTIQDIQDAIQ